MLNFRVDKVGFFSGLTLLILLGVTLMATLLIILIGGWDQYNWLIRSICGVVWVLMIMTVLIRVAIYRYQMIVGKAPNKLSDLELRKNSNKQVETVPPESEATQQESYPGPL